MREQDKRQYLEELIDKRNRLNAVIAHFQEEMGIAPEKKRPEPQGKPDAERDPMPDPTNFKGWRKFLSVGVTAGYTMKELSPVWNAHKERMTKRGA